MNSVVSDGVTRRAFLGGSLAVGGLLLTGCGGSSSSAGTTLRVGTPTDVLLAQIQRFNPNNRILRRTVFDYLIDRNPDGTYQPALATDWQWGKNQTSLVLTLRDGVTFHTGRNFGPDDVIASIQTALEEESGVQFATLLSQARDIGKQGTNQVAVTFDRPFPSYLDALAALPIIDSETYANIQDGDQVIGTGPFTWQSWAPGSELQLQKNGSYWQKGRPSLQGVTFNVIDESQAMLAAIRSGELDLADQMSARDAASLAEDQSFSVIRTEGVDVYVGVNTSVQPLDDIRVRQAIAHALDRRRIVDQVYRGFAEPSSVPWSSSTPGVTRDQVEHYTYSIERGKALLNDAGAVGAEIDITSLQTDPTYGAVQEIAQFGLEKIGLKVNPVTFAPAEFPERMQAGEMPGLWVTLVGLSALGPATALMTANPLQPGENTHHMTTSQYESLVSAVVTASSDNDQAAAVSSLTDYMLEHAFHNTVAQAQSTLVGVSGLTGVNTDLTSALDLTKATLDT